MPTLSSHADQPNQMLAAISLSKLGGGEQIQASERLAKSHAWLMSVAKNHFTPCKAMRYHLAQGISSLAVS